MADTTTPTVEEWDELLRRVDDLEGRQTATVDLLSRELSAANRGVTSLATDSVERFEAVDRRFDEVDARFEAVDRRFDEVDRRLDDLSERVAANTSNISALTEIVEAVDAKVDQLVGHIIGDDSEG